jgi:FkbM family methyltransferase
LISKELRAMKLLSRLTQNTLRLIRSPGLAACYSRWVMSKLMMLRPPVVMFDGGIRFSGFISFSEYWLRHRGLVEEELRVIRECSRAAGAGSIALDVGANLGLFTLALANAGFSEVHAFEPITSTFDRMIENIKLNPALEPLITANRRGVGAKMGFVEFVISSTSPGQNKIAPLAGKTSPSLNTCCCEITTIDSYLRAKGISCVSFMKLDVEGFESDVLKGAMESLQSGRVRFIYSEIIPKAFEDAGSSLSEFRDLIDAAGFDPVLPDPATAGGFQLLSFEFALAASGSRRNVLFQRRC